MTSTSIENVMEQVTHPSPRAQQARKDWEQKAPSEQLSGCRKALYGAVFPILNALANGEQMPVEKLDKDVVDQIEGLFEATFDSYEQKIATSSRTTS